MRLSLYSSRKRALWRNKQMCVKDHGQRFAQELIFLKDGGKKAVGFVFAGEYSELASVIK